MKKSQKGFTLVELVVVIAIIGVLAAILVPSMLGYVAKSRLKSANSNAKTAYNAVAEFIADEETKGSVEASILANAAGSFDAATSGSTGTVQYVVYNALSDNGDEAGYVYVIYPATLNNGKTDTWVVQWCKTDGGTGAVIGQYPDAVDYDQWNENGKDALWGTYYQPQ